MPRQVAQGPKFVQFFGPLIEALKTLGGSGRPDEVKNVMVERLGISEQEQSEVLNSGASRFSNKVDWARFYLVRAGYLDSSTRGVWSLTDSGRTVTLSQRDALAIFKRVRSEMKADSAQVPVEDESNGDELDEGSLVERQNVDYRTTLLQTIAGLSPSGFERLCQRLLRESGFENVIVTGRTGDGGIDGTGILQITPFVSFKVLFQCKRYSGSVSPSQVRDFRGAMLGRTDKGIIITTGTFTSEARKEAIRDGVPQIELVDGEKLVNMFEALKLGLIPKVTFDVDYDFFGEFR
jgi:restriction system protein